MLNENIYTVGFIISIFVIKLLVNFIGMVDFGECAFSKMGWVTGYVVCGFSFSAS